MIYTILLILMCFHLNCGLLLEEYERYAVQSTPHADMYKTWECKGTTQKLMDAAGTQNFQPAPEYSTQCHIASQAHALW